ncbi:MAG: hypothetical protein JWQ09_5154 [Segetibacter sp.]|nr:hypothetical protein [Segetibacter sp.]
MTKQLTVSLNEETVQRVEQLSKVRGKTISEIIEELIKLIPEEEASKDPIDKIHEIMSPYIGKLNLPENMDYKEMIGQWRHEDYIKESDNRIRENQKK